MSVLYSATNVTLNQTGSTISFSNTTVGLNNVSLISNSSSNWTQTQIILFIMLFTLRDGIIKASILGLQAINRCY